jgi:hypothetical protein
LLPAGDPYFNKTYRNFNIKFMNLLKPFDGGLDKGMRKATHPWGLHHHGGGVC